MGKFDSNYTDRGYIMNYRTPELRTAEKKRVMQFRVSMEGIKPEIWRRIQVPFDMNFWDLHVAIQDAMGWQDYHLHQFDIKGKWKRKSVLIGIPDFDGYDDIQEVYPGWEIPVRDHFNDLGVTARYLYDYGDCWYHTVLLEGYLVKMKGTDYPVCTGGARACPPEDCGGVIGYNELLRTLKDPEHEDYRSYREWVGDWKPERFDPEAVEFDRPYARWRYAFLRGN